MIPHSTPSGILGSSKPPLVVVRAGGDTAAEILVLLEILEIRRDLVGSLRWGE